MKKLSVLIIGILCLLGCTRQDDSPKMSAYAARKIMQDVAQRNKNRELLTERDDTLMQRVVAFYCQRGTSNEQMEAYYLHGSVYRDLHDAPKALEAFLNGICVADTTAGNCRYDILVRLYGQKNELLCKQKLFAQAAAEIPVISHYAIKAHDSLYVVDNWWKGLDIQCAYGNYEPIVNECWNLLEKSREWGHYTYAAGLLNTSILANLELGRVNDAHRLMDIYEQESGDVDLKTLESSFPIYYYTKGRLLLAQHKADSAEIFFRRELTFDDWNNRQGAYRGLREVFEQKGVKDSVCKYAVLQCEAVDSDYQAKLSEHLQDLHHLYDYSRAQQDSYQKELQLQEEQRQQQRMCGVPGLVYWSAPSCFTLYTLATGKKQRRPSWNWNAQRPSWLKKRPKWCTCARSKATSWRVRKRKN